MTGPEANPQVVGYVVSFLLGVITILLAALAFLVRGHFLEQKELNNKFFTALAGKVESSLCRERRTMTAP